MPSKNVYLTEENFRKIRAIQRVRRTRTFSSILNELLKGDS